MKTLRSVLIKVVIFSAFLAQLAFASDSSFISSVFAEPVYLTICGVILLAFGLTKNRKEE